MLPQPQSGQGEDLIAVDDLSVGVHCHATVGVAVVRDTGVSTVFQHGRLQNLQVRGTTTVVDPDAVPVRMQGDHVGPGGPQHAWCQCARGSLRAVDHDPKAGQRSGNSCQQEVRIPLDKGLIVTNPADRRTDGTVRHRQGETFGDLVLDLVRQLLPARGKQLDAVVRHGVVAC